MERWPRKLTLIQILTLTLTLGLAACRYSETNEEGVESRPNPGEGNNGTCNPEAMSRIDQVDVAIGQYLANHTGDFEVSACPLTGRPSCRYVYNMLSKANGTGLDTNKVARFKTYLRSIKEELLFQVSRPDRASLIKCTKEFGSAANGDVLWWTIPGRDTVTYVHDFGIEADVQGSAVARPRLHESQHHVAPDGKEYMTDSGMTLGFERRVIIDTTAHYIYDELVEHGWLAPDPMELKGSLVDTVEVHRLGGPPPNTIPSQSQINLTVTLRNAGPGAVTTILGTGLPFGWRYKDGKPFGGGTCGQIGDGLRVEGTCTVALVFVAAAPTALREQFNVAQYIDRTGKLYQVPVEVTAVVRQATFPVKVYWDGANLLYHGTSTPPPGFSFLQNAGWSVYSDASECGVRVLQCALVQNGVYLNSLLTSDPNCEGWTYYDTVGYVCSAGESRPGLVPVHRYYYSNGTRLSATSAGAPWTYERFQWLAPP